MTQLPATPEQAERLQELFEQWDEQLKSFKKYPPLTRDTAKQLNGSRRILENYRRVLKGDLEAGIDKVPAGELFRAISTAEGPGTPVTRTSMPTAALTRR